MGVETTIKFTCDYKGCEKGGQNSRAVVQWIAEENNQPAEAQNIVVLDWNGKKLCFCCALHASMTFLPKGYEITPKKVVEFPNNGNEGS